MTDQEMAKKIVASGVGGTTDNRTGDGKEYYEMRKFEHGVWTFDYVLETSEFVRDERVAVALMEKCSIISIIEQPDSKWYVMAVAARSYNHIDDHLALTINVACAKALENI